MNEKVIEMLKLDMMGEHQAIIQYLAHAYAMGEVPIAFEIEAIARDEMRHFDWLADLIVELGGEPTPKRAPVDFNPGAHSEQLLKDVKLEEDAIAQYRAHMEAIEDAHVRLILARIVNDEMKHHDTFIKLAAEAERELPQSGGEASAAKPPKRLAEILNEGIRHEYTVILQYLMHSYATPKEDMAEEMQNIAINEMQHMGWLAEALVDEGGAPDMSHTPLVLSNDPEEMLKADIAVEREVTRAYTKQASEIEDPDIRGLIEHIRDQEVFHDGQFGYHLEELEAEEHAESQEEPKQAPPPDIPSVGSLIGQK